MNSLERENLFEFTNYPELENPSLIVGWRRVDWGEDAGKLGSKVTAFLNKNFGGQSFCKLKLVDFFFFGGVEIEDDVAQLPESKFYFCPRKDLVLFQSDRPEYEHYKFLNLVLDLAANYCKVKEVYTVAGITSLASHNHPRRISAVANHPELKEELRRYGINTEMDYETPPYESPTFSSYLLWVAKRRGIPAVNIWGEVPFYLVEDDPRILKYTLWFLDRRFKLSLDLTALDMEIRSQNEKIAALRRQKPEVNKYISLVESNIRLSDEENEKLVREVTEFLRKKEQFS